MTNIINLDNIKDTVVTVDNTTMIENIMFSKIRYNKKSAIIKIPRCRLVACNDKKALFKLETCMIKSLSLFEDTIVGLIGINIRNADNIFYKNIIVDAEKGLVLKIKTDADEHIGYMDKVVDLYIRATKVKSTKQKIEILWNISDIQPNNCIVEYDDESECFDDNIYEIGPYVDEFENTKIMMNEKLSKVKEMFEKSTSSYSEAIKAAEEQIAILGINEDMTELVENLDKLSLAFSKN